MTSFSLIVPIAADKPVYEKEIPYVFGFASDGIMICIKVILGLNLDRFDNIFFTILKKHDEMYCLSELFNLQFKRLKLINARVVVLDKPTSSQPETIFRTIQQENIDGSIFVKDADSFFICDVEPSNSVAIFPLEQLNWVNPQHKSYVVVDDMGYITNIIEKKIVSHLFSAGGYCFESAKDYVNSYKKISNEKNIYLSHVVFLMLLNKTFFRPIQIKAYFDYSHV